VPPDYAYRCYEDAYNALKRHSIENGYRFRLKRTLLHRLNVKTRFYYIYDRAGNYVSKATI
jgi:hypothetical protein